MAPVGAAHVYGHRFLSTPETHDRADHASPVGDRVEIVYLYLDAYARFFRLQCFSLLPTRSPWSQREQGSGFQAFPTLSYTEHICNAPACSEKYNGRGLSGLVWREEGSLGATFAEFTFYELG
jgi:hypothetical protein